MKKDLTTGEPKKVLWLFSIPLFLSVIFQQLYNIADSFVAGRYAGEDALASVGNSYEITLIFIAFAFGCNTGCSIICAKLFGAKRTSDLKTAIGTTFIFTFILVVILTIFGLSFGKPLLKLINTPKELMHDSHNYLKIYVFGLFFLFFYNISTGIFSALGDSKTPFIFLLISSVANVFVDILFVKYYNMGVSGVAWATFLCQGVSCIASLIFLFIRLKTVIIDAKGYPLWSNKIFKEIIGVAIPSILQQGSISIGNIIIQSRINSFGQDTIAGYAAAIKLNNLFVTSITALGTATSNYSAQNYGAMKARRILSGFKAALLLMLLIVIVFTGSYLLFRNQLISLFMESNESNACKIGGRFILIVSPFYLLVSIKIIGDGVLRGTGKMGHFMISTFTDLIIRVCLAFILSISLSQDGIWISWPIGWFIGMLVSLGFVYIRFKSIIPQEIEDCI